MSDGKSQAKARMKNIQAMVDRIDHVRICSYCEDYDEEFEQIFDIKPIDLSEEEKDDYRYQYHDEDEAVDSIDDFILDVNVRASDWVTSGEEIEFTEYQVLLSTGGPATRIFGKLRDNEPVTATLQYQDWFSPWTSLIEDVDEDVLLKFASRFYFGS